jgi:ABC-type Fe3+ transport system substrate-binding protein
MCHLVKSRNSATCTLSRRCIAANFVGAIALAATLILGASVGNAQDTPLVADAKKEGEVVWYTTLLVDQAARPLVAAFEAKYPGVKVRFARYNSGEISLRLINEAQAGRTQADVIDGAVAALFKTDLIEPYQPQVSSQYPKQFIEEDGRGTSFVMYVVGASSNTELVKPADQPKTFEDLLDPKWAGKIVWSSNPNLDGAPGFVGLVLRHMGQDKGMDYLRKLSKQKIANVPASSRVVLDQVIGGQFPIALVAFNHHVALSVGKGAPVTFIKMVPLLGISHVVNLVRKAPHPNAGKLLIDFILSEDGQAVLREAGYIPTHPNVRPKIADLNPVADGHKMVWIPTKVYVESMPDYIRIYNELFK